MLVWVDLMLFFKNIVDDLRENVCKSNLISIFTAH